jgi:cyclic beta-1,2-glucan synthetase
MLDVLRPSWVIVLMLVGLLPASSVAVGLTNWRMTRALPPSLLPRMDFSAGIPLDVRTAVVVPAMLTSITEIDGLIAQLELHFLSDTDPALSFALITDFGDADTETRPDDAVLLERAVAGIHALNERFGDQARSPFHLLHRDRRYNPGMACWMGWERKRGKLIEFGRLLAGGNDASWTVVGDRQQLNDVRFVVTLDADTRLEREGARRLIETLAHPLNRAEFDASGRVVDGYTVLQPRVEIAPWSADASQFARIFSGARGLDPYTHAVSDVYQDLFGEGIFVGKGIYDAVAFERAVALHVPENSILSHDLFEGILGRAGLVSDVTVIEDFPATYIEFAMRNHRWTRGDWQLLPWISYRMPRGNGARGPHIFSLISRWKVVDNLRRSLHPPALLALLVVCWCALPLHLLPFTIVIAAVPIIVALPDLAAAGIRSAGRRSVPGDGNRKSGSFRTFSGPSTMLVRWLLQLAFLPHEAAMLLGAISRTLVRLVITRTRLLEWTTAAAMAQRLRRGGSLRAYSRHLWQPPILSALVALLLWVVNPVALAFAAPILLLWLIAPRLAYFVSRPTRQVAPPVTSDEAARLRLVARQTWHFYDRFVGPRDHWLPPDHYQEHPLGVAAHRTSPTNIGFYLLAVIAAWRLGYISARVMAARLNHTLLTIEALPRHRGHLFNWYTTDTLEVLAPRYVSSVDSGNLAGALIVVRQLCRAAARGETTGGDPWEGLLDAVAVLSDAVERGVRRSTSDSVDGVY